MNPADLLPVMLQVAVPLRIDELARLPERARARRIATWARAAGDVVACRGDQLQFLAKPYKGDGGTADTFNHLARGIAALASSPHSGGVTVFGLTWCAIHSPGGTRDEDTPPCRGCLADELAGRTPLWAYRRWGRFRGGRVTNLAPGGEFL